jgi:hypothetical protein
VWLDIAREYTERWHHQHIRDAVGKPGLKGRVYTSSVDIRANTCAGIAAPEERRWCSPSGGDSGSRWTAPVRSGAFITIFGTAIAGEVYQDIAWRGGARGMDREAESEMIFTGERELGLPVLRWYRYLHEFMLIELRMIKVD